MVLRVATARLRDPRQGVAWAGTAVGRGEVAEGQDADQPFVAVDHGQPADLLLRHALANRIGVVVVEAVLHLCRHHLTHRRLRVATAGHRAHGDVTGGEPYQQPVVLADRQRVVWGKRRWYV